MRKPVRIFLFTIFGMLCFLLIVLFLLNNYYLFLEKKQNLQMNKQKLINSEISSSPLQKKSGSGEETLNLIPVPQKVVFTGGSYTLPDKISFSVSDSLSDKADQFLKMVFPEKFISASGGSNLIFIHNEKLSGQEYNLKILPGKVSIEYSQPGGMWYALVSLKVLNRNYWTGCIGWDWIGMKDPISGELSDLIDNLNGKKSINSMPGNWLNLDMHIIVFAPLNACSKSEKNKSATKFRQNMTEPAEIFP